ncbi:MAG TPA: hypothetical protein VMU47_00370 [Caldimonas sp.]|nr:hypothetical protein [Caldimonas sp.]
MAAEGLRTPDAETVRQHVASALRRYWPSNPERVSALPIERRGAVDVRGPLALVDVPLPPYAHGVGVDGRLLVPREACAAPASIADWRGVDWWLAAFLLLEGWHERAWERAHGPVHSYAYRLRSWDERAWDRAWVNRIALWLRAWAAHDAGAGQGQLLGPLPTPRLEMTHDVDAVSKTHAIRIKQSAFLAFNAGRSAWRRRWPDAARGLGRTARFLTGHEDWWMLDRLCGVERDAGIRSTFHFYAGSGRGGPLAWLFDPGYDIATPRIARFVRALGDDGWRVGLHQSHAAWREPSAMQPQRERLESIVGRPVTACRQHWLRFSWDDTWSAQHAAGLRRDATLMFNDRPGLRSAAALEWQPWNARAGESHGLHVLPTVLMDSHLYDYVPFAADERRAAMHRWLEEIASVGGEAAVLWHPHTLTRDYGWSDGFRELLAEMESLMRAHGGLVAGSRDAS